MKLSDYVADKVVELGVRHVFLVTGGGAMHLNHSLGVHPGLECIFNHHEQACAMAAEAYCRCSNKLPLVNVTTGPGGTNAITGVYGAWTDSIGMVVVSGQVKYKTTVRSTGLPLRQYGDQEVDIIQLVRPITKYSVMVTDPKTIRYHLEKAFYLAQSGRPGPCWLDIPLDIQGAQINADELADFDPAEEAALEPGTDLTVAIPRIIELLQSAQRPVLFAGGGVRISGCHDEFLELVDRLGIPVVTGWNAHDVVTNDHPLYVGRPGTLGDRAGNFAVQNADLLLVLGSRLNIRQVSYNWPSFARKAYKIWVDVDELELQKPSVKADLPVVSDLQTYLPAFLKQRYPAPTPAHREWLLWNKARQAKYPVVQAEYWSNKKVNPYCFMQTLFEQLPENQVVVSANGSACVTGFQAAIIKRGQRLWTNSGCASMGYELPGAIGACKATGGAPIVCLAGDGSIMMNLQELQTIVTNEMPIKIFLLNNSGYVSIFQTQRNFFKGAEVGAGPKSGVGFPDFERLSLAFGLPYARCATHDEMKARIAETLVQPGPAICEIMVDELVSFAPKLASKQLPDGKIISPPLEDLAPFLPKDELASNMLIDDDQPA
ncbi:MAG: thiamine pyrophosphate-binding protein [Gammaproteobacteria bacterium]|nr:thiamine pyrophosphate-binding protein [Gammaproteobacteria bacterium]